MPKIILLTGATDGIGLETAKKLASMGHTLLLHGRNETKLNDVVKNLMELPETGIIESYICDLSNLNDVKSFAHQVMKRHQNIDVIINNAGIYKTANAITSDGYDIRFVVNTFAPYLLTQMLSPLLDKEARVVNLSSAAQSPVNLLAMEGKLELSDSDAYAQSKLAITMWSRYLGIMNKEMGPIFIAINPGSFLASKMVKDAFGVAGNDINIGVSILVRAALDPDFSDATGKYYDNDNATFASPHPDALDDDKCERIVKSIELTIDKLN